MSDGGTALVGAAIVVGILGVIVPVLPGSLLAWGAILVWALVESSTSGWVVLAIATALVGGGQVVKILVPGRRLREAGVPRRTILAGVVLGIVGFFVVPVVGLFAGFPLGVYLEERRRLGGHEPAWASTRQALHAIGLSILIELTATVLAGAAWLAVVLA